MKEEKYRILIGAVIASIFAASSALITHDILQKIEHAKLVKQLENYNLTCYVFGESPVAGSSTVRMGNCVTIYNDGFAKTLDQHVFYIDNLRDSQFYNLTFMSDKYLSDEGLKWLIDRERQLAEEK